jgi:iron complex outermembrane receptor protein
VCTSLAWSLCGGAMAAGPVRFDIPAQPLTEAVLAFGIQSDVSIGSGTASACGRSRGLQGRFEIEDGLTRLLAGTGCRWHRLDARAFVIERDPTALRGAGSRPTRPEVPPTGDAVPTPLDDIVVTATKEDTALARVPYALSLVDGPDLDAATRRDTADLTTRLSGLTLTNLGPGRNKLFVRGLADGPLSGQTQAMVGLYLDDTRLTYDVPDPDLRLIDIDRIELLRGPQGTLYGAGSIGGILQIVTRPPDLVTREAQASVGATVTGTRGNGRSADLIINVPLIQDRLAVRAVGYSEVIAGAIDDVALNLNDTGDTVRNGARLGLLWRIDPTWTLRLGYVAQALHSDDSQYAFTALGGRHRALDLREPSRNDFDGVSATLSGDLGWARLKISSAIQNHGLDHRSDASMATGRFGGLGATAYDESDGITALVTEATLSSRPGGRLAWLLGVFATEYSHDRTAILTQLAPETVLYDSQRRDHTDETALYGQASWALTDRLRITGGARLFHLDVASRATAHQGGLVSDTLDDSRSDSGIAPKIVVEYALSETVLLYAQSSEGYRAGGFNAGAPAGQGYDFPGGVQPYRQFRSDELVSYEAGARIRAWNDRLALRLALFAVDWRSIQSDRIGTDGLPFTGNIGDAQTHGLEVELAWVDGPWRVDANLMLDDPDLNDPDPGLPLPADRNLSGVPHVVANVAGRRDLTVASRPAWISGSLGYVGPSALIFSASEQSSMGDYWTSDLAAGLELDSWSLAVRLINPLDSNGNTFAYGNPFLVGNTEVRTPQRPSALAISLSHHF